MQTIALVTFLAILLAGLIVMSLTQGSHSEQLARLSQHQKKLQSESATANLNVFMKGNSNALNPELAQLLVLAGLTGKWKQVQLQWIGAALGGGVIFGGLSLKFAPAQVIILFILGIFIGAAGYWFYLKYKAKSRQDKITRQLPQVLDSMASTLKAGSAITDTFRSTAENAPEPIRSEFIKACSEVQLNKSFMEVVEGMSQRIITRDFKYFVQAVAISEQAGADLADAVASIAEVLRDRFRLRDLVSSLTAQGKLSALIVSLLPYGMMLFFVIASPDYIMPLLNNVLARVLICFLILWEAVGIGVLWKIVSYEV
jgi:tight adherence protein B